MLKRYGKKGLFFLVLLAVGGMLFYRTLDEAPEDKKTDIISEVSVRYGNIAENTYLASGRGVILGEVDGNVWIVTAGHVAEYALTENENSTYALWAGLESEDGVFAYLLCEKCEVAADADLAFVALDKGKAQEAFQSLGCEIGMIHTAAFPNKDNYDMLAQGDAVHVSEYKNGKEISVWGTMREPWIYVEDFGQYMMLADCQVSAGMSGCGLYDGGDRLLGIVCGINDYGQVAAVPLHMIEARWEDVLNKQHK